MYTCVTGSKRYIKYLIMSDIHYVKSHVLHAPGLASSTHRSQRKLLQRYFYGLNALLHGKRLVSKTWRKFFLKILSARKI